MKPVLSLFPGADILGMGFEQEGYCVVRGPDKIWGGDIRNFTPPPDCFEGVIGGPQCQPFSTRPGTPIRGRDNYEEGVELLREYCRCVFQAQPLWFLMENVPGVPDVQIEGYTVQRIDVTANEFGLAQRRLRHIQFGSRDGTCIILHRAFTRTKATEPAILATDTERPFADFLRLQGLPPDYDLPFTVTEKKRAIGNAVPLPVARAFAQAIRGRVPRDSVNLCACGCGRVVTPPVTRANATCRKRIQIKREQAQQNQNGHFTIYYP